ncbi:hypothetical protein WJX74_010820 [Apatococcus lobatus]|uniref:ATP-dependent RNA helicase n=1 Tax=Apatococcus lobatus TaxID=904363 RepID=A0AAW1SHV4_9CHLO
MKRPGGGLGKSQPKRTKREADEVSSLESQLGEAAGAPADSQDVAKRFDDLPISEYTKEGLREAGFTRLTAVQRAALLPALCGRDLLGAAKTGSGKTLAFLIPVLEVLYRRRWSSMDGLGALIISPTRELALQIFDELRKVGKQHQFSAGLLIGGKQVKAEQQHVNGMNMLVCTPGRLLQHMDETPGFDCSQLQVLVLDEADRILDMGFAQTVNAIIDNLPEERQTLLFSATQTKSVKDLVRLSLQDPQYIAVHAEASAPTPLKLQQAFLVCSLEEKVDMLWSFLKTHLKSKVIVFMSTCKQVRFFHEAFKRLRPGVPLRCLHGKMKQMKRMAVFYDFCEAKTGMALFATDIAARGLDFPTVDWVLQMDCPEDVPAYIHRAGRTARFVSGGHGLLMLLPSEQAGMVEALKAANVPVKSTRLNPASLQSATSAMQALLSKHPELKELGEKACAAYLRSVFLQPNKAVFDVTLLPVAEFGLSMGLSSVPQLRFMRQAARQKQAGSKSRTTLSMHGQTRPEEAPDIAHAMVTDSPQDPAMPEGEAATNGDAGDKDQHSLHDLAAARAAMADGVDGPACQSASDAEDEELFRVHKSGFGAAETVAEPDEQSTHGPAAASASDAQRKRKKRMRIKLKDAAANRKVFDEEGSALDPFEMLAREEAMGKAAADLPETEAAARFAQAAVALKRKDADDRAAVQALKRQKKAARKAKAQGQDEDGPGIQLGSGLGLEEGSCDDETDRPSRHRPSSDDEDHADPAEAEAARQAAARRLKLAAKERKLRSDPAHAGMKAARIPSGLSGNGGLDVGTLTLADQEAIALRILGAQAR